MPCRSDLFILCGRFVDRYIPAYMFFGDGVSNGFVEGGEENNTGPMVDSCLSLGVTGCSEISHTPWAGKGLRLLLDAQRNLVDTERF